VFSIFYFIFLCSTVHFMFSCKDCHREFKGPATLRNHKCAWCPRCNSIYSTYYAFQQHKCLNTWSGALSTADKAVTAGEATSSSDTLYAQSHTCPYCYRVFGGIATLSNHRCTWCKFCSRVFSSQQVFEQHMCKKHPDAASCQDSHTVEVSSYSLIIC